MARVANDVGKAKHTDKLGYVRSDHDTPVHQEHEALARQMQQLNRQQQLRQGHVPEVVAEDVLQIFARAVKEAVQEHREADRPVYSAGSHQDVVRS